MRRLSRRRKKKAAKAAALFAATQGRWTSADYGRPGGDYTVEIANGRMVVRLRYEVSP